MVISRMPFEITENAIWYDPLGYYLVVVAYSFETLSKPPAGHTPPLQVFRANHSPFPLFAQQFCLAKYFKKGKE